MSKETEDIVSVMRKAKEEIESMRQQLYAEEEKKHTAMDLCKGYLDELAAALAAIKVKDAFIENVAKQTPEKPDHWSSCSQCEHNSSEAEEALAATDDLDGLILCHAEPCRDDGRCQYAIDHGAEGLGHCPDGKCCMPLYSAREPKP